MSVVIPNVGEVELLDKMLKKSDEDYTLKLFKNNLFPDASTVITDFEEANFTGYTPITLTRIEWNNATIVSGKAKAEYSSIPSWTCGATGNTVYGYWIEGTTSGTLLWTERFDSPQLLILNDVLNIPLEFVFYSAN